MGERKLSGKQQATMGCVWETKARFISYHSISLSLFPVRRSGSYFPNICPSSGHGRDLNSTKGVMVMELSVQKQISNSTL